MQYRLLGATGVHVSAFTLGTMSFGALGNADHDDCARIIRRALDAGVNCIDTADVYSQGESEEICGKAIPYEIDWDSISDDATALNYIDNLSCHRLNMALRMICQDEMGKSAVRDGLKEVKLKNVKDKADMKINFSGGVLEMHCAYALATSGMFSDGEIRTVLEQGL